MANLKETVTWEAGIYQLETTDPVVGGADGVSNKQASQLANRTAYLKTQIEANQTGLNAELAKKLNTETYNTEKRNFALTSDLNAKYNSADMTAAAIANKGVLRDNNGDIQSRALKCTLANQNTTSLSGDAAIVYRMNNGSDNFLRFCSISTFRQAVGLGNVDNTSDANKPISTAVQTALSGKLGTSATASNSDKLGGVTAEGYHRRNARNGSTVTSAASLTANLATSDNHVLSPSANGVLTLINPAVGQSGVIIINNATRITGYATNIKFRVVPTGLTATEVFAYFVVNASNIRLGRV